MALDKNRIIEIESLTQDLLNEVYVGQPIVPPIDLNKILLKSGLVVKFGPFKDPNTVGMYRRSEKTIYLEERDPYVRQVFTAAHELGHHYLHKDIDNDTFHRSETYEFSSQHQIVEQEANWFASSLLMPAQALKSLWHLIQSVDEIALRFGVSSSAAFYRLKNLGLIG